MLGSSFWGVTPKRASKALSIAFEDAGICNMRGRIVAKKKNVAEEANKQLVTKKKVPKVTEKAEADGHGRKLTKLLDRAPKDCVHVESCGECG